MSVHVAFEGLDGCGKTTQANIQHARFRNILRTSIYRYSGKNNCWGALITRAYASESRSVIRHLAGARVVQETLYALSARANLRAVDQGADLVLGDRSIVTAYASHLGRIPWWYMDAVEPRFVPDLVLYLEISPALAMERLRERKVRLRDEDLDSLKEFEEAYLKIIHGTRPRRLRRTTFRIVDATRPIELVADELTSLIARETETGSTGIP